MGLCTTLKDVHVGEVYVIEIVPSSALGTISAILQSPSVSPILATLKIRQVFQDQVNYNIDILDRVGSST